MRKAKFEVPYWFFVALICSLFAGGQRCLAAGGIDINDTRLLAQPAISKNHIAFIYAGDLWVADLMVATCAA